MGNKIQLCHGDGGESTTRLIYEVFYKHFNNTLLMNSQDSAVFNVENGRLAYTTDSFVVKPLFFSGGDIGKLAVCGTVNDLAAAGATPLYITAGFIIEEGFDMELLERVAYSMGKVCRDTGARVVAGDTKVVENGCADGIYINTSGIGIVQQNYQPGSIEAGDEVIVTGTIAEHGTAIMLERYNLDIQGDLKSDCTPLCNIVSGLKDKLEYVKLMKDPTRGGLATALCEIAGYCGMGIILNEGKIPVRKPVQAVNELLGTDPLYLACEGRMVLVVEKGYGEAVLTDVGKLKCCKSAEIIGTITHNPAGMVIMTTTIGGKRILTTLENPMIPRIC